MDSQERTSASRVAHAAVARAVDSLLKWLRRRDDDSLHLVLTLNKVPHLGRPTSTRRVLLPHPFHSSVCLLVDDRPKSALAPSAAAALVGDLGLPVALVLPLSELRSLCRSPEGRQSLADSHDFFLAERRLAPILPSLLGAPFFPNKKKKKDSSKTPVPLDLALPSWPEELRRACGSTVLHLGPGTCSVIKVGRAAQGRAEVIDNVMAAIEGAVGHVPKKWKNVRSLHLKANDSLALPIYDACADVEGSVKTKDEVEEGEEDGSEEESGSDEPGGESRMKVENVPKKHKIRHDNTKNSDAKTIKRRKVKHGID